mmetsp:Transcript_26599/g.86231  ORF Transcript_26599/g.86231 Transcript_26599/m.86231 type:complete len:531 (+) Transcript_26599:250-1842(+)
MRDASAVGRVVLYSSLLCGCSSQSAEVTQKKPGLHDVELVVPLGGQNGCTRFEQILGPSLRLFWPEARPTLIFDDTRAGRRLAARCGRLGRPVFVRPEGLGEWREGMRLRLAADKFTIARFVGHVDDDTLFTTRVTEQSIFDVEGRPRIRGRLGPFQNRFWLEATRSTENILGFKEIARFMAYFPVVVAARHQAELRKLLEARRFGGVNATRDNWGEFNVLCSYLYLLHREQYAWTFQRVRPRRHLLPSAELWLSVAQHASWMPHEHGSLAVHRARMAEGYCFSSRSPAPACKAFRARHLHMDLFRFEDAQWALHPNVSRAQSEHYDHVLASGLMGRSDDEAWVHEALSELRRAELTFPGRPMGVALRGELPLLPPRPLAGGLLAAVRIVDLMQCFVGPARVHTARLSVLGDLSDFVLHVVQGHPPWSVKAAAACSSGPQGSGAIWECRLDTELDALPGDCVGWAHSGAGRVPFLTGLSSGAVLVQPEGREMMEDNRMYALEVVWREPTPYTSSRSSARCIMDSHLPCLG